MDVFKLAIHGTGYPLPGGYDELPVYLCITMSADHRVWQDVYRPVTRAGEVYLKLTVIDDVLIVSFKEL